MIRSPRRRRDRLWVAALVVVLGTIGGGLLVQHYNELSLAPTAPPSSLPAAPKQGPERTKDILLSPQIPKVVKKTAFDQHFQAAAMLLQSGRNKEAIEVLELARKIRPHVPEIYVNLGFAHLALDESTNAILDFEKALSMRPNQVNAYYGLASSYEKQGDLEGALGAMRTYVHLTGKKDPYRVKAMAATWEWQSILDARRKEATQQKEEDK